MKYTVIHSDDPYILARLACDLELIGIGQSGGEEDWWHKHYHPFNPKELSCRWIAIEEGDDKFRFHNHDCCADPVRITVTSRNYNRSIQNIENILNKN